MVSMGDKLRDPLCKAHTEYARIRLHWTRLLRYGMISPNAAIMLAHGSRLAQAGPCHYNQGASRLGSTLYAVLHLMINAVVVRLQVGADHTGGTG